ncbi:mucin-binding protein, partial [Streptococcus suis]|uniref:mucin-binding protein n=1 Tax=Streptococcus suis TaxID=1307 RepID=UPI001B04372F|nr:hypothetical protein [Streptococcus suis]
AYEAANEEAKTYDNDTATTQEFKVVVTPRVVPIDTPPTPGKPVDPNDPDGPKWPEPKKPLNPTDFHKDILRTTTFVKEEDGQEKPAGIPELQDGVTFKRSNTINLVTGEVGEFTDWTATDNGDNTFDGSKVPELEGYVVSRVETNKDGSITKTALNTVSVTVDDNNIVEKVVYTPKPVEQQAARVYFKQVPSKDSTDESDIPGVGPENQTGTAGTPITFNNLADTL